MKKLFLFAIITLIKYSVSFSQGIIRGKITDNNGEDLIGVTVYLKSNHGIGTTTDLDGSYSLKITDSIAQTVVVSYISYKTIEEIVHPVKGQVIIKNFSLVPSSQEIKAVEVNVKAVKAKDYYLESIKKRSATSIDYVSSETMKKTGDANVTTAVTRVAGVSTNGSFITVRGIGDRYVKTAINGLRIPTLDPFTNNIKLDIFPASLIDNVMITKTANPDLPGDWAGAYLSVETKDYPEQLAVNIESSFGYNDQSTLKEVISSQRSSTDWLGYDKDFRDHNHSVFAPATKEPDQYHELVALGLGDYYQSIGVTGWVDNSATGDAYFKLGLMQLGLLAPALFNDPVAFTNAKNEYLNGTYKSDAFKIINKDVPATGKSLPNNWNTTKRKAPLNFSQSFSIGNQTKLFGKPLGFIAGFRYGSGTVYDPHSTANRAGVADTNNTPTISKSEIREISRETNGWSALFNIAYKLNANNSISLMYMPNFKGVNNVYSGDDFSETNRDVVTKSQFYEQRRQLVYQLKTEHFIPSQKIKIEFNASYTNGKSSAPDFKNLQYWDDKVPGGHQYRIGNGIGEEINRYYRYLTDNLFDSRLSLEFPLDERRDLLRKIKLGGAYQQNNKKSDQYRYKVITSGTNLPDGNIDSFLALDNFNIHEYTDINGHQQSNLDLYYEKISSDADHSFGNSSVVAAFAMVDYSVTSLLRISGGLRVEHAKIFTDAVKFDSLGLPVNDSRREYETGEPLANPGKLDETDYLPSLNIIYKVKADELSPINLRVNYSKTVARPSIRELSDISVFDYEYRGKVFGNSDLKPVHINNYDARLETYFKSGDNVSISIFYKDFRNHIELVKTSGYTWQNVNKSHVAGIELEGKKKLGKHFELSANITLAQSQTKFVRQLMEISGGVRKYIPQDTVSRAMFGQAPYVINSMLSYTADSLGLTIAVSYNLQGKRLVVAADVKEIPDIYEQPRNLIDAKISKKLGKHFGVSFTVRDILNTPIVRSYNYSDGRNLDYDRYRYGTNYILSFSYKL